MSVNFNLEFLDTLNRLKRRNDITKAQFQTRALVRDDVTRDKVLVKLEESVKALEAAYDLMFGGS